MFRPTIIASAGLAAIALISGCDGGSTNQSAPSTLPTALSSTVLTQVTATLAAPATGVPGTTTVPARRTTTGQDCHPSATVIHDAAATLAPVQNSPGSTWQWGLPPSGAAPDANTICSPLSAALVTIQGATASSPMQALLFHNGTYVGPATPEWNAFISVDKSRTTADTVGLRYMIPGTCDACSDGTFYCVQFHWDGQQVITIGKPPEIVNGTSTPGTQRCSADS
ncbi:LppP/LprE family lipoprotein [Nocardia sp. NPDC020380]|uniref:LppP/LprE family lipoprotein n=1 Tax=Nocardia sp. NPDC020380 TaxID=3364309 RepID=UPI00378C1138